MKTKIILDVGSFDGRTSKLVLDKSSSFELFEISKDNDKPRTQIVVLGYGSFVYNGSVDEVIDDINRQIYGILKSESNIRG